MPANRGGDIDTDREVGTDADKQKRRYRHIFIQT